MLRNIEVQKALQGIKPEEKKQPTLHEQHMIDMKSSLTKLNGHLGQEQKFLQSLKNMLPEQEII